MYFDKFAVAQCSAISKSKTFLTDTKLYIKLRVGFEDEFWIGFTPDNPNDAYIYNGEVKNDS